MTHEKEIKRDNGDKILIKVRFYLDTFGSDTKYSFSVSKKAKGKRKWIDVTGNLSCSYEYRSLSLEGRRVYEHDIYMQHVTKQEVYEAKVALWELMKPKSI